MFTLTVDLCVFCIGQKVRFNPIQRYFINCGSLFITNRLIKISLIHYIRLLVLILKIFTQIMSNTV